jgi:hypothetical protein
MGREAAVTAIMTGLDNPRGLAFGPEGALYVVEAGRGGAGPCMTTRGQLRCYGPTGALSRLWRGAQQRVASALPSLAYSNGQATGPHDIAFDGRGGAYLTVGWADNPAARESLADVGPLFGTLVHVSASGQWRVIADLAGYELTTNPAGGPLDSNPYGLLASPGRRVLADAGANALLQVKANGDISTVAVFPSRPTRSTDSVPTAVTIGPDGAYYVSELTGMPFPPGTARVYRIVPDAEPEIWLDGFTTIVDLEFDHDGTLYVLQHATGNGLAGPGQLIRVAPDGTRSVIVSDLIAPTSLTIGPDGVVYVTNRGVSIGTGEVLRIEP